VLKNHVRKRQHGYVETKLHVSLSVDSKSADNSQSYVNNDWKNWVILQVMKK